MGNGHARIDDQGEIRLRPLFRVTALAIGVLTPVSIALVSFMWAQHAAAVDRIAYLEVRQERMLDLQCSIARAVDAVVPSRICGE